MAIRDDGSVIERGRRMKRVLVASSALAVVAILAITAAIRATAVGGTAGWRLVGWNNLGMHCMDSQFNIFSILPPYNTIEAQLVDTSGNLVKSGTGITVTYEAVADPTGSINTTSVGKTDFWQNVFALFGANLAPDAGLAGSDMPGTANTPQPMTFDAARDVFQATGIPITPFDDDHAKNYYPLMRLTAKNASGTVLATTDIVLPVSDEMDCKVCHASNSSPPAMPFAGWINDPDPERDYRLNVLRLHDDLNTGNPTYTGALAAKGYNAAGLYPTVVQDGKAILCAGCHGSEALASGSYPGVPPLTQAVHSRHAGVTDPTNGMTLDASDNRSACYRCHPGSETRCLRGAMGDAVAPDGSMAMQCQNCHGPISAVGAPDRTGWLNEPNCQSCHTGTAVNNNGQIRYTSSLEANGQPRVAVNATFATSPDTPGPGLSLYRFSTGHGGLQCSSCHGSTHAEFPSSHDNDNIQSLQIQGHSGPIAECVSCHPSGVNTVNGGPHGMHPVGQTWISGHKDAAENGASACRACHGTDYRGTVLSQSFADRTLNTDFGTKQFWNGFQIGCYTCHNGPSNESRNPNAAPVVTDLSASTAAGTPAAIALHATDANGNPLVLRVVSQPKNGAAGLLGTVATYYPYDGFSGTDFFTYAANDNQTDSNLGRVTVSVGGGSVCTVTCSASAPASAQAGNSVSFTGSATASACADPLTYDWNFGDGSAHAFTASASHTYASPGTYTWSFTAAAGAISCSKSGTITVGATSCTLTCSASVPSTGKVGQELSFSGSASSNCQGEIRYQWQFGDGTGPSGDRTTTHKYNAPGAYTWQFTATRNADSCSKSGTITVSSTATPPVISQITQLSNPFRLRISGSNFQSGAKVYIGSDSAPWSNTTRQSSTSLTLSGSGLRNRFPKGVTVAIRGVNPDGGSATDSLVRGGDG